MEKAGRSALLNEQEELMGLGFSFSGYERNRLYRHRGRDSSPLYIDLSGVSGVDDIGDGRGVLFADFDNDGDSDLFVTNLQRRTHLLYRNNVGQSAHWIRIDLEGRRRGRDAFGAAVRVSSSAGTQTRVLAGGSGFLSQHDPRLLFGLGVDEEARVEITWPSGSVASVGVLKADRTWRIVEDEPGAELLDLPAGTLPDPVADRLLAIKVGDRLPGGRFRGVAGGSTDLSELLPAGSRHIVNLWASWCRICPREMRYLATLARGQGRNAIVGISIDDPNDLDKVRWRLHEAGADYPAVVASEEYIARLFGSVAVRVPITLLVAADGTIAEIHSGWRPSKAARLERFLQASDR